MINILNRINFLGPFLNKKIKLVVVNNNASHEGLDKVSINNQALRKIETSINAIMNLFLKKRSDKENIDIAVIENCAA